MFLLSTTMNSIPSLIKVMGNLVTVLSSQDSLETVRVLDLRIIVLVLVLDTVVLFFFSFLSFFLFNFIRCPCNVFDVIVSP